MRRFDVDLDIGESNGWEGGALHGVLVKAPRLERGTWQLSLWRI